jgi:hypothetical protein
MPKTVDDAFKRLIANMPFKYKVDKSKLDKGELVNLHFTFGVFIRNQFELLDENADMLNFRMAFGRDEARIMHWMRSMQR